MKEKNTYAILIDDRAVKTEKYHASFASLEIRIVRIIENGGLRNPGSEDSFNDLVFQCQWDTEKNFNVTYGWEAVYKDVFRVDHSDAKRMFKTLQKIETISEGFAVRPVTFGQYVTLNAYALGIKTARKESRDSARSSSYAENHYVTLDLQNAQWAIDDLIAKVREPKQIEA